MDDSFSHQKALEQVGFRAALLLGKDLSQLTPRQRAILKLRFGLGALTPDESQKVLPAFLDDAQVARPRTLQEVAEMFGRTRERIRQIENQLLEKIQKSA